MLPSELVVFGIGFSERADGATISGWLVVKDIFNVVSESLTDDGAGANLENFVLNGSPSFVKTNACLPPGIDHWLVRFSAPEVVAVFGHNDEDGGDERGAGISG